MIKFPKMHIAQSVQNRILNARDEIMAGQQAQQSAVRAAPPVPDAAPLSEGIDEALANEVSGAGAPPLEPGADSAAAVGSILTGGTAIEGLLKRRTEAQ